MLIVLIWVLLFIRPFIPSLAFPFLDTLFSYLLIGLCLVLIKVKRVIVKNIPAQGYLFLFLLAIVAAAFVSFHPIKSQKQLVNFLVCFFVFYVVYGTDKIEKQKIILILILTATSVSLYALYWFYFGAQNFLKFLNEHNVSYPFAQEYLSRRRAFMPFVLPSMLAGYLIMMLPLSLGYLFKENKNRFRITLKNIFLSLPALLIVFVLFLTKSIGAFLSIFLSLLLFVVLYKIFTPLNSQHLTDSARKVSFFRASFTKRNFLIALALLLALVGVVTLRSYRAEYYLSPVFSLKNRLFYWQKTIAIILKHPLRGIGLGNFPFIQSQFAHNSYLQIWAETGLLGIIGFLGFLYKSLQSIQTKKLTTDRMYAAYLIANLSFLIHNFIDFSFYLPEVALFWWIIMGLFLAS